MWGTKKWEIITAISIIFIFGYGTYVVVLDIITGHPIWWYNISLPLFALTILGLLLLVRQAKATLGNILSYGFNPSSKETQMEEDKEVSNVLADDADRNDDDKYFGGNSE